MRLIDENGNNINRDDCDLSKGEIIKTTWVDPKSYETIDNVTKFAIDDDDYEDVEMYRLYTETDYQAMEEAKRSERDRLFLNDAPARVDAIESGVNDAYEATAELGVEVADHAVTLDDIMNAVAELGVELEAING